MILFGFGKPKGSEKPAPERPSASSEAFPGASWPGLEKNGATRRRSNLEAVRVALRGLSRPPPRCFQGEIESTPPGWALASGTCGPQDAVAPAPPPGPLGPEPGAPRHPSASSRPLRRSSSSLLGCPGAFETSPKGARNKAKQLPRGIEISWKSHGNLASSSLKCRLDCTCSLSTRADDPWQSKAAEFKAPGVVADLPALSQS